MKKFIHYAKALPQYILPQHTLSSLIHRLAQVKQPWLKSMLINRFIRHYGVDLSQAQRKNPGDYAHFNDFFTRALEASARPLAPQTDAVVSPVDGTVSELGHIDEGRILQIKGRYYTVRDLLRHEADRAYFENGVFATLYLSPRDYHRIHAPLDCRLLADHYIPGRLFAVNPPTVSVIPRLFSRNERVCCLFETPAGRMMLIFVGALLVGSIQSVWHGMYTPPHGGRQQRWQRNQPFCRGQELGRFNMGSTVIVLFENERIRWAPQLQPGKGIQMGAELARLNPRELLGGAEDSGPRGAIENG